MTKMEAIRKLANKSKSEAAREAQVNASDYGKIESRRLIPYGSQLRRIADALGYEGEPIELLDEVQLSY